MQLQEWLQLVSLLSNWCVQPTKFQLGHAIMMEKSMPSLGLPILELPSCHHFQIFRIKVTSVVPKAAVYRIVITTYCGR